MSDGRAKRSGRPAFQQWVLVHQNAIAGVLLACIAVLAGVSLAVGDWLTRDGEVLDETVSAVLWTTPVVLPIAIAAVLGGLAVHRRGWIPALGLSAGLWLGPIGSLTENEVLIQVGIGLCGVGIVGFWAAGWVARFPMWVGFGPVRSRTIQRPSDDDDPFLSDDADGTRRHHR